jgi:hypothetical protein
MKQKRSQSDHEARMPAPESCFIWRDGVLIKAPGETELRADAVAEVERRRAEKRQKRKPTSE